MKNKVAIIGGGITGLTTGYFLSKAGFSVTIFEKEEEIGGLLRTTTTKDGEIEMFYHHFFKSDSALIDLYRKLDLYKDLVFYKSSVGILKNGKVFPFNTPVDLLKLPFLTLIPKIRLGIGSFLITRRASWEKYEQKTAKEVVFSYQGSVPWQNFWRPMFEQKFGEEAENISGAWFWGRLKSRLGSRKGTKEMLGYPKGGFKPLLDRLMKEITKSGGEIITGKKVAERELTDFDYTVSTICPKIQASLGVICVLLELKEKMDHYWLNVFDDLPFGAVISQANLVPGYNRNPVYLSRYLKTDSAFYKKKDEEIKKIFTQSFLNVFNLKKSDILSTVVFRSDCAQPVITPGYKVPIRRKGNVFYTSMAHIYPFDRGLNQAVSESLEIAELIKREKRSFNKGLVSTTIKR